MPIVSMEQRKKRPCIVCKHTKRKEIENRLLAGERARDVAQWYFGLNFQVIEQHMLYHVDQATKDAAEVVNKQGMRALEIQDNDFERSRSILDLLWETQTMLGWGMMHAKEKGAVIALAQAGAQRIRALETLAKMYMQLAGKPTDSEQTREEDWKAFQELVTESLSQHPEARAALGDAILKLVKEQRLNAETNGSDDNG